MVVALRVMQTDVLVIGAGQAGLSAAHHLRRLGLDHVVLDAEDGPGGAWRHRWPTLTMATVNGIRELPGATPPPLGSAVPAAVAVPATFADYEADQGIEVVRPVTVRRVEGFEEGFRTVSADGRDWWSRALVNATGTWNQPHLPSYPGAASFAGDQVHTKDFPGPGFFAGRRVAVIGGGISAVQHLQEILPVVADHAWFTRRPPRWRTSDFDDEAGRAAVAQVVARVEAGLPPRSVVSVTGLLRTPELDRLLADETLLPRPMFDRITPEGVGLADGSVEPFDILLWATGFRAALRHLAPLSLREPGGGITLDGTAVVRDRRLHLVGYGPSSSTIGANRAGRQAARDLARLLAVAA